MDISKELENKIQNKGYETRSGRVSFKKSLRYEFRKESGDYSSEEWEIKNMMIDIYNDRQF